MSSWNVLLDYVPSGAASGPPLVASGVSDPTSAWKTDGAGNLVVVTASYESPLLLTQGGALADTRIVCRFTYEAAGVYFWARCFLNSGTYNGYILGLGTAQSMRGYAVGSGLTGLTATGGSNPTQPLAAGTSYDADVSIVGNNISFNLYSVTPGGLLLSGTLLGSFTATDSTYAASVGYSGLGPTTTSGYYTHLRSFTDVAGSPDFYLESGGPATVEQTGTATVPVQILAESGYTGTATLSVSGLPTGVTGSFSPATLTGGGTVDSTLTLTATSAPLATATATATATDSANSLTHTASVSVTVVLPPVTISPSSSASLESPGNWVNAAGGRAGGTARKSWYPGAWRIYSWSTTSGSPTASLAVTNPTAGSTLTYWLNGVYGSTSVPSSGSIPITVPAAGTYTLVYLLDVTTQQANRWDYGSAITDAGLTVDSSSTPVAARAARPWVQIVGDSLTEGVVVANSTDYSYLLGVALDRIGRDYSISACGGNGWLVTGAGGVPPWYSVSAGVYSESGSRWDKIDGSTSILDSAGHVSGYGGTGQEPVAIVVNFGTNEAFNLTTYPPSDITASVAGWLAAARTAAPGAALCILRFFASYTGVVDIGGMSASSAASCWSAIQSGVANYQAANPSDANVHILDIGHDISVAIESSNGYVTHFDAEGHAYAAAALAPQLQSALGGTSTDPGTANVRSGTAYEIAGTSLTGTCHVPTASQVLSGIAVDATTGNVVLPTAGQVEAAVTFGPASATTGTYDPITGNYTDPGASHVEAGTTYKFAGSTETGTLVGSGPSAESLTGTVVSATTTSVTISAGSGTVFNATANAYASGVPRYLAWTSGSNKGLVVTVTSSSVAGGNLTLSFGATAGVVAATAGDTVQVD